MAEKNTISPNPTGEDRASAEELLPAVYDMLRRLAHQKMRNELPGQTLQPTALVHEVYLRLRKGSASWHGSAHFYGAAAEAMRRILIERARTRKRLKHGGGLMKIPLDLADPFMREEKLEILELDEALTRLERKDARKAQIIKLRYFVGFTIAETARILDISPTTVKDDWTFARAWLQKTITDARTC